MAITSLFYDIPSTMKAEHALLEIKCNLLIEAFNQLCKDEKERLRLLKVEQLAAREFIYTYEHIGDDWWILHKEAKNPVKDSEDNTQWSIPFKIVNNVMIHREHAYERKSYAAATKMLPKNGEIIPDGFDIGKLVGW